MAGVPHSNTSVTPSPSATPSQTGSISLNPPTPPLNGQDASATNVAADALNQQAATPAQTPHTATNQTQAAKEGYLKLMVSQDSEEVKKANWKQSMAKAFGIGLTVLGVALVVGGIAGTIPALAFGGPAGLLALAAIPIGIAAICYGMNKYEGADNPKNTEWGKLISACNEKQTANPERFNAFMRTQFKESTLDLAKPEDRAKLDQALKAYDNLDPQDDAQKGQAEALNSRMQKTTEQLMNASDENEIKELSAKLKEQRKEFRQLDCAAHIPKKGLDDDQKRAEFAEHFTDSQWEELITKHIGNESDFDAYNRTNEKFTKWIIDNAQYYPEPQPNAATANEHLLNIMFEHYQDDQAKLSSDMKKNIETFMTSKDEDKSLADTILKQHAQLDSASAPFPNEGWYNDFVNHMDSDYWDNLVKEHIANTKAYDKDSNQLEGEVNFAFTYWIRENAHNYPEPLTLNSSPEDKATAVEANKRLLTIMFEHYKADEKELADKMRDNVGTLMNSSDEEEIERLRLQIAQQREKLDDLTGIPRRPTDYWGDDWNQWYDYSSKFSDKERNIIDNDERFRNWLADNAHYYPEPLTLTTDDTIQANTRLFEILHAHYIQSLEQT